MVISMVDEIMGKYTDTIKSLMDKRKTSYNFIGFTVSNNTRDIKTGSDLDKVKLTDEQLDELLGTYISINIKDGVITHMECDEYIGKHEVNKAITHRYNRLHKFNSEEERTKINGAIYVNDGYGHIVAVGDISDKLIANDKIREEKEFMQDGMSDSEIAFMDGYNSEIKVDDIRLIDYIVLKDGKYEVAEDTLEGTDITVEELLRAIEENYNIELGHGL